MDNIPENIVPEIVERQQLTKVEKKIARIKDRMVDLLEDSLDVLHTAIKGNDWKDTGKKVTRTQLYAASPIVTRFAPEIEKSSTGAIHFHMNVPRPKPQVIDAPITVQASDVMDITQAPQNKIAPKVKEDVSPISDSDSLPKH